MHEAIKIKSPDLWKNNSWLFHHNNAPATLHRSFLAKNNNVTKRPDSILARQQYRDS